jgi:hypothetical protein
LAKEGTLPAFVALQATSAEYARQLTPKPQSNQSDQRLGGTKRATEFLIQDMHRHAPVLPWCGLEASPAAVAAWCPSSPIRSRRVGSATVTQTDVKRYFMTIPEAVQLVLYPATLAKGRETFVLEMGERIKVVDMVRNLIRLSGFSTEEIPVTFVGMRPGEKLYEGLVGSDETVERAGFRQILSVIPKQKPEVDVLSKQIAELEKLAIQGDISRVIDQLCEIVPTYAPDGIPSGSGVTQVTE